MDDADESVPSDEEVGSFVKECRCHVLSPLKGGAPHDYYCRSGKATNHVLVHEPWCQRKIDWAVPNLGGNYSSIQLLCQVLRPAIGLSCDNRLAGSLVRPNDYQIVSPLREMFEVVDCRCAGSRVVHCISGGSQGASNVCNKRWIWIVQRELVY